MVAIAILAVVAIGVVLVAQDRAVHNRTDEAIIRDQAQKIPEPELSEELTEFSFEGKSISPAVHANFVRVTMGLQPQIGACLGKWPNPPDKTLIFMETDAAGRLTNLSVQNASKSVNRCLLLGLSRGQYNRRASGIAELKLTHWR